MTEGHVAAFIRHPEKTKPGVRMPSFSQLSNDQALALARYLQGLK